MHNALAPALPWATPPVAALILPAPFAAALFDALAATSRDEAAREAKDVDAWRGWAAAG